MFDFVSEIFDEVTSWLPDGVEAVVETALKGAVAGALIGAASAAIRGGDILEGALKGSAYGGLSTGVVEAVGQLSGMGQLSAKAIEQSAGVQNNPEDVIGKNVIPETESTWSRANEDSKKYSIGESESEINRGGESGDTKKWYQNPETQKLIASTAGGALTAYGEMKAAEDKHEADKDLEKYKEDLRKARIADNTPGAILGQQTAKIDIAGTSWWDRHFNKNTGLLATGG